MPEFLPIEEALKKPFLFVSYSQKNKDSVFPWVNHLLDSGVLAWYDIAFNGGDDWKTLAEQLISHQNCHGIIFFASKESIASQNVAIEWRAAAQTKKTREEGKFYSQIIMVDDGTDELDYRFFTNYVKKQDEDFSDDDFIDFLFLFGKKDPIVYRTCQELDKDKLINTIKNKAKDTLNERALAQEKVLDRIHTDQELIVKLGSFDGNPVIWRELYKDDNETTLICQNILAENSEGESLTDWIDNFIQNSFSYDERKKLKDKVRFLTVEEAAKLSPEKLSVGKIWWLAESNGNLQSVIREDGTVYKYGYNRKLCSKGIRPALTIEWVDLNGLQEKNRQI